MIVSFRHKGLKQLFEHGSRRGINPQHVEKIENIGLSVADAAQGLGITRQQLYNVITGKSAITSEMAVRLEKAIGSTADAWLRMQAAHDVAQVRMRQDKIKVRRLEPRHA